MKPRAMKILRCPACRQMFQLESFEESSGEILQGLLRCSQHHWYPIINGIPRLLIDELRQNLVLPVHLDFLHRFRSRLPASVVRQWQQSALPTSHHTQLKVQTARSFGYEWTTFLPKTLREKSEVYRRDFLEWIKPISGDFFKDKIVLEAGCGVGRHTYLAAQFSPKELFAIDLSDAVQATYENTREFNNVHVIQADIYHLPFANIFDYIFSIGVLHHLPYPEQGFHRLVSHLANNGTLSIWVYGRRHNFFHVYLMEAFRKVTRNIPFRILHIICYLPAAGVALCNIVYKILLWTPGLSTIADHVPFKIYADLPFIVKINDAFDILATPKSSYWKREEIVAWYRHAGIPSPEVAYLRGKSLRAYGVKTGDAVVSAMEKSANQPLLLHCIAGLVPGGAERMLLRTITRQHDFSHIVFCLGKKDVIGELLEEAGVPVVYAPMRWSLPTIAAIRTFRSLVNDKKPDILITYLPLADLFGKVFGRLFKIKTVICSLRNSMRVARQYPYLFVETLTNFLTTHHIAVSESVRRRFKTFGIPQDKITVIPNGIPLDEMEQVRQSTSEIDVRRELGIAQDAFVIGVVGRLRKDRGQRYVLEAFAQALPKLHHRALLLLVGDGPEEPHLMSRVETLGITASVRFLGFRNDVFRILTACDLSISSGLSEGMSNALLETMAMALPIIAIDIPENRELLYNEELGIVVKPRSVGAMAEAILRAAQRPDMRAAMGRAAYERAQQFSIDNTVRQLSSLLKMYVIRSDEYDNGQTAPRS